MTPSWPWSWDRWPGAGGPPRLPAPPFPASLVVPSPLDSQAQPLPWARFAQATDTGDNHPGNDDRCLIVASRDLSGPARRIETPPPFQDYLLLVLADGATGSTFTPHSGEEEGDPAGWRASQIAQAVFLQSFFASTLQDPQARLVEGIWRADHALASSPEGRLASTLTALFLSADGTACGASVGNSAVLALPQRRQTDEARRLRKLGYRDRTALGNGETALIPLTAIPDADADAIIETWRTAAVTPGTVFALLSDGIADSLPTDAIDRITRRRSVQRAAPEIIGATRTHRLRERRREKASLSDMGLDNMSAILARYDGPPASRPIPSAPLPAPGAPAPHRDPAGAGAPSPDALPTGRLVWLQGLRGGPHPGSGGPFGLVCLAPPQAVPVVLPRFLRAYLDSEDTLRGQERLARAYVSSAGPQVNLPFSAVSLDAGNPPATFAVAGGAALPLPSPGRGSSRLAGRPFALGLNARPPPPPPSFSAPATPYALPTGAPPISSAPTAPSGPSRGVLLAGTAAKRPGPPRPLHRRLPGHRGRPPDPLAAKLGAALRAPRCRSGRPPRRPAIP